MGKKKYYWNGLKVVVQKILGSGLYIIKLPGGRKETVSPHELTSDP